MNTLRKGMTLMEVTITTAILGIMMLIALEFMSSMGDNVAYESSITELESRGTHALNYISESLRAAWLPQEWNSSVWNNGDESVAFLLPVDPDDDGDIVNNTDMAIEWGATRIDNGTDYLDLTHTDSSSSQNFRTAYSFIANPDLEYSEAVKGVDLNRDGDLDDIFEVGHISISHPAATSSSGVDLPAFSMELTADFIVRKKDQTVGDIDELVSDPDPMGQDDPMFWQSGSTLYISIFVANTDEVEPQLLKLSTAIELRNFE